MAGDMPELNTDSFVDTIANTVGVLIVLAVVSIALSSIKRIELDPTLGKYHKEMVKKEHQVREMDEEISQLQEQVEGLVAKNSDEIEALDTATQAVETASATLNGRRARQQEVEGSLSSLRRKRQSGKATLARARKVDAEEAVNFTEADLAYLEKNSLDDIDADLSELAAEAETLTKDAAVAETTVKAATEKIGALEADKAMYSDAIEVLKELGLANISVKDPLVPYAKKRGLWIECFGAKVEDRVVPSVLVVNEQNYKKEGKKLKPISPGEDKDRIKDSGSAFQQFLASKTDEQKQTYFLHFMVRPDAYPVFRKARAIALVDGWEVRWDPIPLGDGISLGQPSPPK